MTGHRFEYKLILANNEVRAVLPSLVNGPTIGQIRVPSITEMPYTAPLTKLGQQVAGKRGEQDLLLSSLMLVTVPDVDTLAAAYIVDYRFGQLTLEGCDLLGKEGSIIGTLDERLRNHVLRYGSQPRIVSIGEIKPPAGAGMHIRFRSPAGTLLNYRPGAYATQAHGR